MTSYAMRVDSNKAAPRSTGNAQHHVGHRSEGERGARAEASSLQASPKALQLAPPADRPRFAPSTPASTPPHCPRRRAVALATGQDSIVVQRNDANREHRESIAVRLHGRIEAVESSMEQARADLRALRDVQEGLDALKTETGRKARRWESRSNELQMEKDALSSELETLREELATASAALIAERGRTSELEVTLAAARRSADAASIWEKILSEHWPQIHAGLKHSRQPMLRTTTSSRA